MEEQLNLDNIIQLKFDIEKEIETLTNNFEKLQTHTQITTNHKIFLKQYNANKKMFGEEYIKQQNILLKEINKFLEENCDHSWIYDTIDEPLYSRNICYCSKCYLYKFKTIA